MRPRQHMLAGMGLALCAAMLWALTLGVSLLVPAGMQMPELLSGRYGAQVFLLVALVMPRRGIAMMRTARPALQIVRGLTMLVMPFAFAFAAHRLGAGEAWAALWLGPLFGLVFGHLALRERVSWPMAAPALLATAGAMLAHTPARTMSIGGIAAVLVAAASFGVFLVLTRALRDERPATGLLWTALCVLLPSLALMPFEPLILTRQAVAALAAMGTLWLLVLFTIDESLRRAPLWVIAPCLLTEVLWVRLLFHTPWPAAAREGAVAIAIGVAVCLWHAWRRPAPVLMAGGLTA